MLKPNGQLTDPADLGADFYDFAEYVSPDRMLTYWHQIDEVLQLRPDSVLEVGAGPGVVASVLRGYDISVDTADLNARLRPTYEVPVTQLAAVCPPNSYDVVLCARVLHHIDFQFFPQAITAMAAVASRYVVLTLPVDDLRLYFSARVTSRPSHRGGVRLPRALKHRIQSIQDPNSHYTKLWKIDSSTETRRAAIETLLRERFTIEKSYAMPHDKSHRLFVLRVRP